MPRRKEKLNSDQKSRLEGAFNRMKEKVTREDVLRVAKTFEEKFKKAKEKLKSHPRFRTFVLQCELLYSVVRDWIKGEYEVPWQVIGAITAALLYVINPVDLIPDFIPVIGYIDDVFVVALCIRLIQGELKKYCDARGLNRADYGLDAGEAKA